jgi:hypothetical protein
MKKSVRGFGEKPERRRTLGRPRHRWEDRIRMDVGTISWGVE